MNEEEYREHLRSVVYFIKEKGDPERYSDWEKVEPEIRKRNPELVRLHSDLNNAEERLKAHVEKLEEDLLWPGLE